MEEDDDEKDDEEEEDLVGPYFITWVPVSWMITVWS